MLLQSAPSQKKTLAKLMATQEGSWQKSLGKAVKAINDTPKEVLLHEAHSEVLDNPEVNFMLLQGNARTLRHNALLLNTRKAHLEEAGAMREPLPAAGESFKRGHEAAYREVKQLRRIEGSVAVAQDGTRIDVKHLKAVSGNSTDVTARFGNKDNSVTVASLKRNSTITCVSRRLTDKVMHAWAGSKNNGQSRPGEIILFLLMMLMVYSTQHAFSRVWQSLSKPFSRTSL